MRIIAVDDERPALWTLEQALCEAVGDAEVSCFTTAQEALQHAGENLVDVAFLDIEMGAMNGLELARRLKDIRGGTNIIFVTAYSRYMQDAFDLYASGYVFKPVSPKRITLELKNLRHPVQASQQGVFIRCFGNFEVFADGKPVPFGRPKAKEMLAYLIDRQGASISKKEMAALLWENESYTRSVQSHLHVLFTEMLHTLEAVGAGDIIIRQRGHCAVDVGKVRCDYYRYQRGDAGAVNSYHGEYMTNYSWAKFTAGLLAP